MFNCKHIYRSVFPVQVIAQRGFFFHFESRTPRAGGRRFEFSPISHPPTTSSDIWDVLSFGTRPFNVGIFVPPTFDPNGSELMLVWVSVRPFFFLSSLFLFFSFRFFLPFISLFSSFGRMGGRKAIFAFVFIYLFITYHCFN
ncbi:hypothetical protein I7I53_01195 [Histoplasma capsulatum var. duboisii H88]|uniref:Uncharacterized protein n=1 Tax=Ajellomyces capsulatus (strain H88) TaxID=544711 RepID=A0A8A1LHG7_AJEC8|nr:hypothetical protein I7I53_01195 [Histoplasma capsulatum var. duboisii H88]